MLELARLIKRAYRKNGVVTAYVYGDFGAGKTSYALWTAYEVLGNWNRVLDYLFFDPSEAVKVMERAVYTGERLPLIIMDDAGLWLDKLTWWEESKVAFMEFFNLIRSVAAGIIFTTPSEELPKQVVKKCFFRVSISPTCRDEIIKLMGSEGYEELLRVTKRHGVEPVFNKAVGYRLRTLPSFMEYIRKEYYDFYPHQYPVYKEYEEKRRRALKAYFEKWRSKVEGSKAKNRADLIALAKELIKAGKPKAEVVKELIRLGVPCSTAYRWLSKLEN